MPVVSYILQCTNCKTRGKTDTFAEKYDCPKCHATMNISDVVLADNHAPIQPFIENLLKAVDGNDSIAKKQLHFIADTSSVELRNALEYAYCNWEKISTATSPSSTAINKSVSINRGIFEKYKKPCQCWLCFGKGHIAYENGTICPLCRGKGTFFLSHEIIYDSRRTIFDKKNNYILINNALKPAKFYFDIMRDAMLRSFAIPNGIEKLYMEKMLIILYFYWIILKFHTEHEDTNCKAIFPFLPDTVVPKYKVSKSKKTLESYLSQYDLLYGKYLKHNEKYISFYDQYDELCKKEEELDDEDDRRFNAYMNARTPSQERILERRWKNLHPKEDRVKFKMQDMEHKMQDEDRLRKEEELHLLDNIVDIIAFLENALGKDLNVIIEQPDPSIVFLIQQGDYYYDYVEAQKRQEILERKQAEEKRRAEAEFARQQAEKKKKEEECRLLRQQNLVLFAQHVDNFPTLKIFLSRYGCIPILTLPSSIGLLDACFWGACIIMFSSYVILLVFYRIWWKKRVKGIADRILLQKKNGTFSDQQVNLSASELSKLGIHETDWNKK